MPDLVIVILKFLLLFSLSVDSYFTIENDKRERESTELPLIVIDNSESKYRIEE